MKDIIFFIKALLVTACCGTLSIIIAIVIFNATPFTVGYITGVITVIGTLVSLHKFLSGKKTHG